MSKSWVVLKMVYFYNEPHKSTCIPCKKPVLIFKHLDVLAAACKAWQLSSSKSSCTSNRCKWSL